MMTKSDSSAAALPPSRPALLIDEAHYERLAGLARQAERRAPALARQLLEEVERAELVPSDELPDDVVTIGSEVTYRDAGTGRTETVRLAFPAQADIDERRISVLTPVGAALIGLSAGQTIDWEMAGGSRRTLTVLAVLPPADRTRRGRD